MAVIKSSSSTTELVVDSVSKAARVTLYNSSGIEQVLPTLLVATTLSAANTTVTLTLSAVSTSVHYISSIEIVRINDSAAAVAGTALLNYTTTNLPGSLVFSSGNLLVAGDQRVDVDKTFSIPLKSSVINTNTTIVAPAAGLGIKTRITVYYYTL